MNSKELGKIGEKHVEDWLSSQGSIILARNYRWRGGEIDIIAQHDNVVSFIEVKMRQHHYFALSEIITPTKQRNIIIIKHLHIFYLVNSNLKLRIFLHNLFKNNFVL